MPYAHENVQLGTIADLTPAGTAKLTSNEIKATWLMLTASGTSIRVGNSTTDSSHGLVLPTGVPVLFPRGDFEQQGYYLDQIYVYGSGSDKVSITYAV